MRTVLTEYEKSGYFWEIYDDSSGNGMRGHPFSGLMQLSNMECKLFNVSIHFLGWTTLFVNIMAELY